VPPPWLHYCTEFIVAKITILCRHLTCVKANPAYEADLCSLHGPTVELVSLLVHVLRWFDVIAAMWMSNQRSQMEGLLDTQWKDHFTYEKQPGSKLVFEKPENKKKDKEPGIDVNEEEELFEDYAEDEVQLSA